MLCGSRDTVSVCVNSVCVCASVRGKDVQHTARSLLAHGGRVRTSNSSPVSRRRWQQRRVPLAGATASSVTSGVTSGASSGVYWWHHPDTHTHTHLSGKCPVGCLNDIQAGCPEAQEVPHYADAQRQVPRVFYAPSCSVVGGRCEVAVYSKVMSIQFCVWPSIYIVACNSRIQGTYTVQYDVDLT